MGYTIFDGELRKYREEPGVTEVVIPDGVMRIRDHAFSDCSSLTSVIIPDGVTNIGKWAFSWCKSLTSVVIPDSVTSIGYSAFEECSNLTTVTIPDSVMSIEGWAFYDCSSLIAVTLPNSVTSIGMDAFDSCEKLKSITIFGYTIDATQWNREKVKPSDVQSMLENKDYSVKINRPTKYQFVSQVFLKDNQPEAEAYIKKYISKILPYFIDIDDYATVKGLLEHGKFVTKRNIMKYIDHAIEHTQSGGDMQIQVLLMNYKNDNFPDMDPLKSIKFQFL